MSTTDIVLAIFLLYFVYKGYSNGFIVSIATLIGLVLGFYAASHFSEFTASWLQNDMDLKSNNFKLIAYLLTFIVVMVLVFLLGKFLTGVVKTAGLGIANRLAGTLFGLAKGVLLASFFLLFISRIDPKENLVTAVQKKTSVLYKPISQVAPLMIPHLAKFQTEVEEFIHDKDNNTDKKKD